MSGNIEAVLDALKKTSKKYNVAAHKKDKVKNSEHESDSSNEDDNDVPNVETKRPRRNGKRKHKDFGKGKPLEILPVKDGWDDMVYHHEHFTLPARS